MEDVVEDSRDEGTALKNLFLARARVRIRVLRLVLLVLHCWSLLGGLLVNELVKGSSIKQLEQKFRRHCLFLCILCGIADIIIVLYLYPTYYLS